MREQHGLSQTQLHKCWRGMRDRCYNLKHPSYKNYGGRGILMCPEWFNSFLPFYSWANLNGYKSWLDLDRENNNEGYSPENCRWVTRKKNIRNSRVARKITAFGETKTMIEWAEDERCKTSYITLQKRFSYGWPPERAISTPSRNYNWR